jgi:hypothetical protein
MFKALWRFITECLEALRDDDAAATESRYPHAGNYDWHIG